LPKTALVPIANGTEELEAVTLIDTLRRAGAQVTVASVEVSLQVTASRGVKLVADLLIKDCLGQVYDLIVLPGGMPGAERLRDSSELAALLKQQAAAERLYGAICASPAVVLQHHGLIGHRRATAFPGCDESLANRSAIQERVVVDGPCATSRGPGTALEFALKLVELLFGGKKRDAIANEMLAAPHT